MHLYVHEADQMCSISSNPDALLRYGASRIDRESISMTGRVTSQTPGFLVDT